MWQLTFYSTLTLTLTLPLTLTADPAPSSLNPDFENASFEFARQNNMDPIFGPYARK